MKRKSPVYVAGHRGLIGSAILRKLRREGYTEGDLLVRARGELDLLDRERVRTFFMQHRPNVVFLAAGKVGGILENRDYPADFLEQNLTIQGNVFRAAHEAGVERLFFFASSCMYPRDCAQPMQESALLTGRPEATSLAYAMAKLAGVQTCLAYNTQYGSARFVPLIPNSTYGPNDNFDPRSSHVLSALIRKFHDAKKSGAPCVELWGSGSPRREFLHADDLADACFYLMGAELSGMELPLNIGPGTDCSIAELAAAVARVTGYEGRVDWDTAKPDGAPRKLLDNGRITACGWKSRISLDEGLRGTYAWFLENEGSLR